MIPEIKNILYATDLSENARYAFRYAASLANRYQAGITVLHVLEELSPSAISMVTDIVGEDRWGALKKQKEEKMISVLKDRIDAICRQESEALAECRFIIDEIVVTTGHPVDQIMFFAKKKNSDILVMGSRGQGMFAQVMLGSTSRRVLKRCKKPVLVVRLPEKDEG